MHVTSSSAKCVYMLVNNHIGLMEFNEFNYFCLISARISYFAVIVLSFLHKRGL